MLKINIGNEVILWPLDEATRNRLGILYDRENSGVYRTQREKMDRVIISREAPFFCQQILSDLFRRALETDTERDARYLVDLQLIIKVTKSKHMLNEFSIEKIAKIINTFATLPARQEALNFIGQAFGKPPVDPDNLSESGDESSNVSSVWSGDSDDLDPDSDCESISDP